MKLAQLRYFVTLAKEEHYRKAAEKLYISQPTLTASMQALEKELGTPLFEKSGRNVRLTNEGREFADSVRKALRTLDAGVEKVKNKKKDALVIGCITPMLAYLSSCIKQFERETAQRITIRTWISRSEDLLEKLSKRECDVIFCTKPPVDDNLQFFDIVQLPFVVVLKKDDPLAKKGFVLPEDLKDKRMLLPSPGIYTTLVLTMLDHFDVHPEIAGYSAEEVTMLRMAGHEDCFFITTDYPEIHSPDVAVIPLKQNKFARSICMVCRKEEHHALLSAFLEFFTKENAQQ